MKITTHGDFLIILSKKAKAMDIMLKLRKVTFINIDNLPKEDEPE